MLFTDEFLVFSVQKASPPVLLEFLKYITFFGSFYFAFIFFLFSLIFNKSPSKVFYVLVFVSALVFCLKCFFNEKRPYEVFNSIEQLVPVRGSSFPSGHSAISFAIAVLAEELFNTKLFFFVAFLVAFSRVALGVHFVLDVVFGALLGFFSAKYVSKIDKKIVFFVLLIASFFSILCGSYKSFFAFFLFLSIVLLDILEEKERKKT